MIRELIVEISIKRRIATRLDIDLDFNLPIYLLTPDTKGIT